MRDICIFNQTASVSYHPAQWRAWLCWDAKFNKPIRLECVHYTRDKGQHYSCNTQKIMHSMKYSIVCLGFALSIFIVVTKFAVLQCSKWLLLVISLSEAHLANHTMARYASHSWNTHVCRNFRRLTPITHLVCTIAQAKWPRPFLALAAFPIQVIFKLTTSIVTRKSCFTFGTIYYVTYGSFNSTDY